MAFDYNTSQGRSDAWKSIGLDPNGQNEFITALQQLLPIMYPHLINEAQFQAALQPGAHEALKQLLLTLSSGGYEAARNRENQAVASNAATGNQQFMRQLDAAGINSPALRAGGALNQQNQTIEGQNAVNQRYMDPSFRAQGQSQLVNAFNGGMNNNPYLQQLMALNSQANAKPQPQQNGGFFGMLGSLLPGLGSVGVKL